MLRPLLLLCTLSLVAACGETTDPDDKTPDAGTTDPNPAVWGLADKTCLRYADAEGRLSYTVQISKDSTTITGVETYSMLHRHQGFAQRTDWVEVTADSLLLHRRNLAGGLAGQDTLHRFSPPVVFLVDTLETGKSVETTTEARLAGGESAEEEQTFRLSSLGEESVEGPEGEVLAQRLTLQIERPSVTTVERLWFAPQLGIVKFDPPGTDIDELRLSRVDVLENGEICTAE